MKIELFIDRPIYTKNSKYILVQLLNIFSHLICLQLYKPLLLNRGLNCKIYNVKIDLKGFQKEIINMLISY